MAAGLMVPRGWLRIPVGLGEYRPRKHHLSGRLLEILERHAGLRDTQGSGRKIRTAIMSTGIRGTELMV
jgi:hypothetical protein